jgi:hypothetical protein
VSADKKQDRAQIEKAARAVADKDYPHLRAALQYAKDYTSLGSNAFGSVPSRILMPRYNPARQSQIQNLEDGLDRLAKMIAGMNEVAFRMAVTEQANTIDLTKIPQVPVTRPDAPSDVINGWSVLPRFTWSLFGHLRMMWKASALLKCSFAPLMVVPFAGAMLSLSMWVTVQPDDEEIGKARSAWFSVADELDSIGTLKTFTGEGGGALLPKTAWDDDAREAFDVWVTSFSTEVDNASTAAYNAMAALEQTLGSVKDLHDAMRAFDAVTTGGLIVLWIAGLYPLYRAPAAVAQNALATINVLATGLTVGSLCMALLDYGYTMGEVSENGRFEKLNIDNDPGKKYGADPVNDTFVDLDIDWLK